jgi:hypothetical protein
MACLSCATFCGPSNKDRVLEQIAPLKLCLVLLCAEQSRSTFRRSALLALFGLPVCGEDPLFSVPFHPCNNFVVFNNIIIFCVKKFKG